MNNDKQLFHYPRKGSVIVLNRLSEYCRNLQFQIRNMLPQRVHFGGRSEWCSVAFTAKAVLLIKMRVTSDQLELLTCASEPIDNDAKIQSILTEIVKKYNLKGVDCCWVLQPEDYQFLSTERLPVKAAEFQAAIRWKIKDLLTIPVDEAVIDSFLVPGDQFSQSQGKMMVIAARLSYLQKMRNDLEVSGFSLKKITIPELGLKNIIAHYEKDTESTVLVYAHKNNIQLIFTNQKQFYFSRYLGHGLGAMEEGIDAKPQVERLLNELNRSFDYYQSHWHLKPPTRVLLAATIPLTAGFLQELKQDTSLQIHSILLSDFLKTEQTISPELQALYFPLVGSVMIDQGGSAT